MRPEYDEEAASRQAPLLGTEPSLCRPAQLLATGPRAAPHGRRQVHPRRDEQGLQAATQGSRRATVVPGTLLHPCQPQPSVNECVGPDNLTSGVTFPGPPAPGPQEARLLGDSTPPSYRWSLQAECGQDRQLTTLPISLTGAELCRQTGTKDRRSPLEALKYAP